LPLPDDPASAARVRRLLEGPVGETFRLCVAVLFAGVFGAAIVGTLAPFVVPRLPLVSTLACPPDHRIAVVATSELAVQSQPRRGENGILACRDEDGRLDGDARPHVAILQTGWLLATLALLPLMRWGSDALLAPRRNRLRF
jgi:hypothetical protein